MSKLTALAVRCPFCVALMVAGYVPTVVGVPVTTPLTPLIDKPGGRPDALKVVSNGQFGVYVVVYVNATPVCPLALAELVTDGPTVGPAMLTVNVRWSVVPPAPAPEPR